VDLTMRACPRCGAWARDAERFCGVDGTPLDRPTGSTDPARDEPSSETRAKPLLCARCGAPSADVRDGVCISCGFRSGARISSVPPSSAPASNVPLEIELPADKDETCRVAASAHPGLRRDHNEDAVTFGCGTTVRGLPFRILVVCDGVSTSSRAEQASQIASRMIRDDLTRYCQGDGVTFEGTRQAMASAIRAAHAEICAQGDAPASGLGPAERGTAEPPGTTCVAALVLRERLTVGWVGDSRAYWLTERGIDLLTRDHSWANEAVASGEVTMAEALRSPHAHALTRCLGPHEAGQAPQPVTPDVVTRRLTSKGVLLLCSDGLWNYYPIPEQMAALVQRCGPAPTPDRLARFLVHKALSRGGHDNVSVAVYAHGAA
jgi:serine/threonine protein phosphatase PrpC